jgi:glycine/D-amino acid oxidase-like deaminating enzyme
MTPTGAHIVIVGAGIAGASAAYFAARRGAHVTLIDAGHDTASRVPSALVNPVRGQNCKVIEGGARAARFTFALVESLTAAGFRLPHGRGLWRPVPDAATRLAWGAALSKETDLPHRWDAVPKALGLSGDWHSALYLPESGWVETAPFLEALVAASGADRVTGTVEGHPLRQGSMVTVSLAGGAALSADRALWCGGALGASQNHLGRATFRPGSVLVIDRAATFEPMSYGLYSAPYQDGAVIGPTSEPRAPRFDDRENPGAIARLHARAKRLWGSDVVTRSAFRGVRLEGAPAEPHCESLTGFGGRGFLMAPLAASRWADSL